MCVRYTARWIRLKNIFPAKLFFWLQMPRPEWGSLHPFGRLSAASGSGLWRPTASPSVYRCDITYCVTLFVCVQPAGLKGVLATSQWSHGSLQFCFNLTPPASCHLSGEKHTGNMERWRPFQNKSLKGDCMNHLTLNLTDFFLPVSPTCDVLLKCLTSDNWCVSLPPVELHGAV